MDDVSLSSLLRSQRRARHLTQEQLAEASGLSVRSVRNLESGAVSTPRVSSLQRIAEALRLDEATYQHLTDLAVCGHHECGPTEPATVRSAEAPAMLALRPGLNIVLVEVSRNGALAGPEGMRLIAAGDTIAALVPVSGPEWDLADDQGR
jgi:transcriptional regulator with XRE-family HTH domain